MPHKPLDVFQGQSLGVPLLTLVQDYESRIIAAYKIAGFDNVLRSHGAVLRYLGMEGARISDIALRAGITKQTVGRIVRDLERLGYITVVQSAADRRARLVRFSPRGEQLVVCSLKVIEDVRSFYSRLVGAERFQRFCLDLDRTVMGLRIDLSFLHSDGLGSGSRSAAHGAMVGGSGVSSDRFYHFGRLLVELSKDFEQRLEAECAAMATTVPARPMLALFYCLSTAGSSVTELARHLPVTVQAVSLTVRQMAHHGWLTVSGSEDDSRAKHVSLSAEGAQLLNTLNGAMGRVRAQYMERLGKTRLLRLESGVRLLANCLAEPGPDDIGDAQCLA